MVGSAINQKLESKGYHSFITHTHSELDFTNLYGPNGNYDPDTSHVMAALIRKFHEAKTNNELQVVVQGTGAPAREFLHVDDMADACACI